jgi:hypothetical protein
VELLIEPGRCSVCRLDPGRPWPVPPAGARLYSATRTADELSVVCAEGDEPEHARVESGWRCLRIVGPLAFDLVGVLASVTVPLAASGIGVFVLSTFDTDLVLVKDEDLDPAVDVLGGAGHRVGVAGTGNP